MANQNISPLFVLSFFFTILSLTSAGVPTYNVQTIGAKPDSKTDSTKYFLSAWASACSSAIPATVYVPQGKFLVGVANFEGKCNNSRITFWIDGTLIAPKDYNEDTWLQFHQVDGLTVRGGTIDGQGGDLWDCKSSGKSCPKGATSLSFQNSNNIEIIGLTLLNSQMFHIVFNECQNVNMQQVKAFASSDSPNTDGFHIEKSSFVSIYNSVIGTGDDCISMGAGTTDVWIEQVICGPGHGISIGSLGREMQETGVHNVTVKSATFNSTQNGFRIKTWSKRSNGFVNDVTFENATMVNVDNPLLIDQNYCPSNKNCPSQGSSVKISDVKFKDIQGTSSQQVALKIECSKKVPCSGIILEEINLSYDNEAALAQCVNAAGTVSGEVVPAGCLQ